MKRSQDHDEKCFLTHRSGQHHVISGTRARLVCQWVQAGDETRAQWRVMGLGKEQDRLPEGNAGSTPPGQGQSHCAEARGFAHRICA